MQQPYISFDTHMYFSNIRKISCFAKWRRYYYGDRPDVQLYKLAAETIKQLLF